MPVYTGQMVAQPGNVRRWLQFGLRDLAWAIVALALAAGWYADSMRQEEELRRLRMEQTLPWIDGPQTVPSLR